MFDPVCGNRRGFYISKEYCKSGAGEMPHDKNPIKTVED
jgi:hypothetical protein